jgi:hypothetical protein
MSRLLDEILTAHGGLERWRAVTALTAHGRFGGLLRSRFPGNRMANVAVRVQLAEQHAIFHGFPQEDQQAVFDRGDVRIETRDGELIDARRNARAAFAGLSGLRRDLRWDALDAAYFAGYAWWNYLSTPMLLTREGVTIAEGDSWPEAGEQWRRLEVSFPPDPHPLPTTDLLRGRCRPDTPARLRCPANRSVGARRPLLRQSSTLRRTRLSHTPPGAPTRNRRPVSPQSDPRRTRHRPNRDRDMTEARRNGTQRAASRRAPVMLLAQQRQRNY